MPNIMESIKSVFYSLTANPTALANAGLDNSVNIENLTIKANNPNEFFSQLRNVTNLTRKK